MNKLSNTIYDIAIIGAGIAGTYCAAQLRQAGFSVAIVEKSRGTGGRASSRRLPSIFNDVSTEHANNYSSEAIDHIINQQQSCDLGAPFLHASAENNYYANALNKDIEQWLADAVIGPWPSADIGEQLAYTGLPKMSTLPRYLAQHSDLYAAQGVSFISRDKDKNNDQLWCLRDDKYKSLIHAQTLIITAPAEQSCRLLASASAPKAFLVDAHAAIEACQPQWVTAISLLTKALPSSFAAMIANLPDVLSLEHPVIGCVIRDTAKPNRQGEPERWVVQANLSWSLANLELKPEQVSAALLEAFYSAVAKVNQSKDVYVLGNASSLDHVNKVVSVLPAHRWRLGRHRRSALSDTPTQLMRWDAGQQLGLAADWLADGTMAGAIASARALSREIIITLRK